LDPVINPWVLYAGLAVGALGVSMALPRPRISPQVIGALIAFIGLGAVFLGLGLRAGAERPGFFFYVFSAIALGSALRVISHPRPVYAALYFILTVISSSALYLMLQAEFLAFALVIIYAGAILITYLFVIMLAEQAPSETELGTLASYDRFSREPVMATGLSFVLLALLSSMFAKGVAAGEPAPAPARGQGVELLERMPRRVLESLDRAGVFAGGALERPALADVARRLDLDQRTIVLTVTDAAALERLAEEPGTAALLQNRAVAGGQPATVRVAWPSELREENLDGVGFALVAAHPMALELAGVILLMAMLGAVVLARKQIEISEDEKAVAAAAMRARQGGGA